MCERMLMGLESLARLAAKSVMAGQSLPGMRLPTLIVELLEDAQRVNGVVERFLSREPRVVVCTGKSACKHAVAPGPPVINRLGPLHGLIEYGDLADVVATLTKSVGKVG